MRNKDWNQVVYEGNENFTKAIDEVSATVIYVGTAPIGTAVSTALWQIKKITVSGTVTLIQWANGDDDFIHVWDDRASYTYS